MSRNKAPHTFHRFPTRPSSSRPTSDSLTSSIQPSAISKTHKQSGPSYQVESLVDMDMDMDGSATNAVDHFISWLKGHECPDTYERIGVQSPFDDPTTIAPEKDFEAFLKGEDRPHAFDFFVNQLPLPAEQNIKKIRDVSSTPEPHFRPLDLPEDVLKIIIDELSIDETRRLATTCRTLHFVSQSRIWSSINLIKTISEPLTGQSRQKTKGSRKQEWLDRTNRALNSLLRIFANPLTAHNAKCVKEVKVDIRLSTYNAKLLVEFLSVVGPYLVKLTVQPQEPYLPRSVKFTYKMSSTIAYCTAFLISTTGLRRAKEREEALPW